MHVQSIAWMKLGLSLQLNAFVCAQTIAQRFAWNWNCGGRVEQKQSNLTHSHSSSRPGWWCLAPSTMREPVFGNGGIVCLFPGVGGFPWSCVLKNPTENPKRMEVSICNTQIRDFHLLKSTSLALLDIFFSFSRGLNHMEGATHPLGQRPCGASPGCATRPQRGTRVQGAMRPGCARGARSPWL